MPPMIGGVHHSFPWTILQGAGYDQVRTFGTEAIPFLLKKLQESYNRLPEYTPIQGWGIMCLLGELTGVDIFEGEIEGGWRKGNVQEMEKSWIRWGQQQGYLIKEEKF